MSINEVYVTLVDDYVSANLAGGRVTVFDNDPLKVDTSSIWYKFSVLWGQASQVQIPSRFRQPGVLTIQVFAPRGTGTDSLQKQADVLMDYYRARTIPVAGSLPIHFRTPYPDRVGQQGQSPVWQLNVNCPFFFDIQE